MSRCDGTDKAISEQVVVLANEIRDLKACLAAEGLTKDSINRHEAVLSKVSALQALKKNLASDDPSRDEAILARLEEERRQRHRQQQADAADQQRELQAAEKAAKKPLVQRKIFHLFCHAGSGDTFCYEPPPRLNAGSTGFGEGAVPHPAVYITEKWDGTTMQATSTHIFKRTDLWGKKKKADPADRYDLKLVAWRTEDRSWHGLDFAEADVRFSQALRPYLPNFEMLDDGLCVYFEVVHTDINANFKHIPNFADIRIFDFSRAPPASSSRGGGFLPFEETIRLAAQFNLPIVGWEYCQRVDAGSLWAQLSAAAAGREYATAEAQIEGFVVREAGEGGRIAKARVEHVQTKYAEAATADVLPASGAALWERQAWTPSYLEAIGLSVVCACL
jgi:multidrug efflux pump subunit AcrA (membrane-fusion protein)